MKIFRKNKVPSIWPTLLGITFFCCTTILFKSFSSFDTAQSSAANINEVNKETAHLLQDNCKHVCSSAECLDIANGILKNMDPNVDPCDDFNAFACGKYEQNFGGETSTSMMNRLNEAILLIARDILETSEETKYEGSAAQKMKFVYDSCMNSRTSEVHNLQNLLNFVSKIGISNWPHFDENFTLERTHMLRILANLSLYEEGVFVRFIANEDFNKVEPQYSLYEYDSTNGSKLVNIKNILDLVWEYAGIDIKNMTDVWWEDFIEVENEMQNLFKNNSKAASICNNKSSSSVFINCTENKNVKFQNMFCEILSLMLEQLNKKNVSDPIISFECENSYYMENLPSVLESFSDRSVAHYIVLRTFIHNLKYINFRIRKNSKYFLGRGGGPFAELLLAKDALDHWKFCIAWIAEHMTPALGNLYTSEMLPKTVLDELTEIVTDYTETGSKLINLQNWIKNESKISSSEMIREVHFTAGGSVWEIMQNSTMIDRLYEDFQPSSSSFIQNILDFKQFLNSHGISVSPYLYEYFTSEAIGGMGFLDIKYGMLLPPLFKFGYPKLFNRAKIGLIIGHEIGHNFYFSLDDALRNGDAMSNQTLNIFEKKIQCIQDQYSQYELERTKTKLNGSVSKMEDFADTFGLRAAESIAETLIPKLEEELFALPGIDYPLEEIFYITAAQTYCGVLSLEFEKGEHFHSPPKFRVIGPVQNSMSFPSVFNCPTGSRMNPIKKCTIIE